MTDQISPLSNLPRFDEDEILAGIEDWVKTESPTYDPRLVNIMMDKVEVQMAALGAKISRVPGVDGYGDVVMATVPGRTDGPGILVLGHLDTVHPEGTLKDLNPWRREGDRVYGPGVYDMKGGFYLAYYALKQLLAIDERPGLPVTFMFIPDEEVGSPSTQQLIEETARAHAHILVPEPSADGNFVTGRYAFQRFRVCAKGLPAHAGWTLHRGRSAVREIAEQIVRIEEMSDPEHGITFSVGVIEGGKWVNVVPIHAACQILAVSKTPEGFDEVHKKITSLQPINPGIKLTVEVGPVRPLFEPNEETLSLYETAREIAREVGFDAGHCSDGGGSDGNFTGALGLATLDGLGVTGDGPHTHEEYMKVSCLVPRAKVLAGLYQRLR